MQLRFFRKEGVAPCIKCARFRYNLFEFQTVLPVETQAWAIPSLICRCLQSPSVLSVAHYYLSSVWPHLYQKMFIYLPMTASFVSKQITNTTKCLSTIIIQGSNVFLPSTVPTFHCLFLKNICNLNCTFPLCINTILTLTSTFSNYLTWSHHSSIISIVQTVSLGRSHVWKINLLWALSHEITDSSYFFPTLHISTCNYSWYK